MTFKYSVKDLDDRVPSKIRDSVFLNENNNIIFKCSSCGLETLMREIRNVSKKSTTMCRSCWVDSTKSWEVKELIPKNLHSLFDFDSIERGERYGSSDWSIDFICEMCNGRHKKWIRSIRDTLKNFPSKGIRFKCDIEGFTDINYSVAGTRKSGRSPKIITSGGYVRVLIPDHPMSDKNGYMLEHRLVVEQSIGRYLYEFETVHHKNGDKQDNTIENLQLRTGQHGQGVSISCGDCGSHNIKYNDL